MARKTKLKERPARIPDISQEDKSQRVEKYLKDVQGLPSEASRSHRFSILLNELFEEVNKNFIEDYLKGMEKYVKAKKKDIIVRGRVDTLYGNLVIEFESALGTKLPEAEDQLKRYIYCLWKEKEERDVNYLCIATDGINFQVFSPSVGKSLSEPEDVTLQTIEKVNFQAFKERPYEAYYWLDRYFFRKRTLSPTTEEFEKDFGLKGPAFHFSSGSLNRIWREVKDRSDIKVIYENWEKYLRVTYGSTIASEELFLKHTYLATLAKLMVWMRLTGDRTLPTSEELLSILLGEFFEKKGFVNFLEEDFFSWVGREYARDTGLDVSRKLIHQLAKYNLNELSEDVLKGLYQELVDPETRHDLGEYYTPDWLAQRMVEKTLADNPRASVLDPACGSGTFLYMVVRYKKDKLGDSRQTLEHILENTAGIEIHPLAVIISKTNYLLALGELLKKRKGPVNIPIYMADSIRPPAKEVEPKKTKGRVKGEPGLSVPYTLPIEGKVMEIPDALIQDPQLYDRTIEVSKEFATHFAGKDIGSDKSAFLHFLKGRIPQIASNESLASSLYFIAKTLKEFIEKGRDTIWAFILKNIFKPLFLREKFDVVIGNPPWLSFRYVEKGEYQAFLKTLITKGYFLLSGSAENISNLELATLFFPRSADLYLRKEGTISFVLPRSIFTADQHDVFRRSVFPFPLALKEVWDLERVKPLFNVPACVFFARKGGKTEYPLTCQAVSGQLEKKNASLEEAEKALSFSHERLSLETMGKRSFLAYQALDVLKVHVAAAWQCRSCGHKMTEVYENCPKCGAPISFEGRRLKPGPSYYKPYFKRGADIIPRAFWFVEIVPSKLGFDPERPYVQTASTVEKTAKPEYKGIRFEGNVERDFLYATLLSTDVVPFGYLDFRLVVLPVKPSGRGYELLKPDKARKEGFLNLAKWLDKAEKEWKKRRGEKASKIDACAWLDYRKKLTTQDRQARYKVLYPDVTRVFCSCIVENKHINIFVPDGPKFTASGFLVDTGLYYYDTENRAEAFYLSTILNSSVADHLIRPFRRREQAGQPHVHKKIWEFPIPGFDPKNKDHLALAELGERCTEKVEKLLPSLKDYKGIGHIRRIVKGELKEELAEIDGITRRVLGL